MCLIYYYFEKKVLDPCREKSSKDEKYSQLGGDPVVNSPSTKGFVYGSVGPTAGGAFVVHAEATDALPKPPIYYYAILSCFDLTATLLSTIGVKYVTASAVQMLRGSTILFTGFCTVLLMKKSLTKGQWGGIFIVMIALAMVGASSALRSAYEPASSSSTDSVSGAQVFLGIVLILVGSLLNSIQNVVEESLLKGQNFADVHPLEIVGWEGFFGGLITMGIVMPVCQQITGPDLGVQEDSIDTFIQLGNSGLLQFLCIGFAFSLALMNNYSQVLSKNLSAVIRMLVSTCRVVVVWIVGLIIYNYDKDLGESWDRWSYLQLAAFVVLVTGTFVYVYARDAPSEPQKTENTPLTSSV